MYNALTNRPVCALRRAFCCDGSGHFSVVKPEANPLSPKRCFSHRLGLKGGILILTQQKNRRKGETMNRYYEPAQMKLFEWDALDVMTTSAGSGAIPRRDNPNQLEWDEVI